MSELVNYVVFETPYRKNLAIIGRKNTFPSAGDVVRTIDDEFYEVLAAGWCLEDGNELKNMKAVLGDPIEITDYYRKMEV